MWNGQSVTQVNCSTSTKKITTSRERNSSRHGNIRQDVQTLLAWLIIHQSDGSRCTAMIEIDSRTHRWLEILHEFGDHTVEHRASSKQGNTDTLSRRHPNVLEHHSEGQPVCIIAIRQTQQDLMTFTTFPERTLEADRSWSYRTSSDVFKRQPPHSETYLPFYQMDRDQCLQRSWSTMSDPHKGLIMKAPFLSKFSMYGLSTKSTLRCTNFL